MGALAIIVMTVLAALLAAIAQYLFKKTLPRFRFHTKEIISLLRYRTLLLGLLVYFISLGIYLVALYYGQLSFVYPIFASSFAFVLLFSKYLLNERIGTARIVGVALVVIGITAIAFTY